MGAEWLEHCSRPAVRQQDRPLLADADPSVIADSVRRLSPKKTLRRARCKGRASWQPGRH